MLGIERLKGSFVAARSEPVAALVSTEDIRKAFYNDWATGDRFMWWCRQIYIDPNELLVEDFEGELHMLEFVVDGDDVEFPSEPRHVVVRYEDVASEARPVVRSAAVAAIASVRGNEHVAASFETRAESRPDQQEGGNVDLKKLRETLKLSADTSDEEVLRVAAERLSAEPEAEPEARPDAEPEAKPEAKPEGDPEPEPNANASALPEGTVLVDAAALATLQADAAKGAAVADRLQKEDDDRVVLTAIKEGKIPPSRREHFEALLKADREGTVAMINGLHADVVPVAERGIVVANSDSTVTSSGYPTEWMPDVVARKERLTAGHPRVSRDKDPVAS